MSSCPMEELPSVMSSVPHMVSVDLITWVLVSSRSHARVSREFSGTKLCQDQGVVSLANVVG